MNITILGCGAYGCALAFMFNENKCNITLWSKFDDEIKSMKSIHPSLKVKIPYNFIFTTNLKDALSDADVIVIAVPAGAVNNLAKEVNKFYNNKSHIIIASKGIEQNSCLFVTDIIQKYIRTSKIAVISGGTFAIDMINKVPMGLSVATKNKETEIILKNTLENKYLKLRFTKDILGLEICGSIKNIIAIATGILDGLGYPESTKCMFLTESLHDIKSLIKALGGSKKTILSYAGFGDLILTCNSIKSRNYSFGKIIGQKKSKNEIDEYIKNTTIEGLYTLKSIHKLIKNKKVSMPIINLMYDIIFKDKDPEKIAIFLMEKE